MKPWITAVMIAGLGLAGCGGGDSGSATTAASAASQGQTSASSSSSSSSSTNTQTETGKFGFTRAESTALAFELWRDSDLSVHPKGSCSGCHGADFLDLAVIGSTEDDIVRRAKIDGATERQAQALADAIAFYRTDAKLPARAARSFRPFQPGGAVILPDLTDAPYLQAVKRDIAFGLQLQSLLPVLSGQRISGPGDARRARDQLLDLARGTNTASTNPRRLNLRQMPTGITYPLWSADVVQGAEEGTFNDWIADIARDAPQDKRAAWLAVQDRYLATPNRTTFWQMYDASKDLTTPQLLGECTYDRINPHLACAGASAFNKNKFLTALIGQHMMRVEAGLASTDFFEGPLPFAYIDTASDLSFMLERPDFQHLPSDMWEIGDQARVMLDESSKVGSFREVLRKLGFPSFAQDSIDPNRTSDVEQQALRLSWFWIGFTFDPSLSRISNSNATRSGEYIVASLIQENMFLHNSFLTHMRLVAKGFLTEANVRERTRPNRIEAVTPVFDMNYSYFTAYNRTILRWNENARTGTLVPADLKTDQANLWHRFTANGFRMSLYLYLDAPDAGATPKIRNLDPIKAHFDHYQPEHKVADTALLNAVRAASGDTGRY